MPKAHFLNGPHRHSHEMTTQNALLQRQNELLEKLLAKSEKPEPEAKAEPEAKPEAPPVEPDEHIGDFMAEAATADDVDENTAEAEPRNKEMVAEKALDNNHRKRSTFKRDVFEKKN